MCNRAFFLNEFNMNRCNHQNLTYSFFTFNIFLIPNKINQPYVKRSWMCHFWRFSSIESYETDFDLFSIFCPGGHFSNRYIDNKVLLLFLIYQKLIFGLGKKVKLMNGCTTFLKLIVEICNYKKQNYYNLLCSNILNVTKKSWIYCVLF